MEPQIVIGSLLNPYEIQPTQGEIVKVDRISSRAFWSFFRLQNGKQADAEIKRLKATSKTPMGDYLAKMGKQQKQLQYILLDGQVKAIASTKHLLIPPSEVEATVRELTKTSAYDDPALHGLVLVTQTQELIPYDPHPFKLGIHVFCGDIFTRRAISISNFIEQPLCFNPLTFADIGGFNRFGINTNKDQYTRVLRITKKEELRPRITKALDEAKATVDKLVGVIERSKEKKVKAQEARQILTAFASAYGIGLSPIREVINRLNKEPKTLYGMASASSFVARHGETFRAIEGKKSYNRQGMATVAGACILIDEPKVTAEKARKWLKGNLPKTPEWLKEV